MNTKTTEKEMSKSLYFIKSHSWFNENTVNCKLWTVNSVYCVLCLTSSISICLHRFRLVPIIHLQLSVFNCKCLLIGRWNKKFSQLELKCTANETSRNEFIRIEIEFNVSVLSVRLFSLETKFTKSETIRNPGDGRLVWTNLCFNKWRWNPLT